MPFGARYAEDVEALALDEALPWDDLAGSCVVVTGATGLLGGLVADAVIRRNELCGSGMGLVLPVRDVARSRHRFPAPDKARLVAWDAAGGAVPALGRCDVVVHCASTTSSRFMVERPVDTIATTVHGTEAMLELARSSGARLCFASSMEVYGAGSADVLDERRGGELDAMSVRSSYPQAKQLAETLVASYASQFGVAGCVARLAQSFGPGVSQADRRVFAEFARCCMQGRDIALLTDGSKSNMYLYTADAARALLLLACRGAAGEAYNVANEDTYCSILQMARGVCRLFGGTSEVTRVVDGEAARRYAVSGSIRMDTGKIRALGWAPTCGLDDMFRRMTQDWESADEGSEGR